jgi:hypothetical protein
MVHIRAHKPRNVTLVEEETTKTAFDLAREMKDEEVRITQDAFDLCHGTHGIEFTNYKIQQQGMGVFKDGDLLIQLCAKHALFRVQFE